MNTASPVFGLKFRTLFIIIGTVLFTLLTMWASSQKLFNDYYLQAEKDEFKALADYPKIQLSQALNELGHSAIMLAQQPEAVEIAHAYASGDRARYVQLKKRVEQYYYSLIGAQRLYLQLRIISAKNLREIVRVERSPWNSKEITTAEGGELQYKGERSYIKDAKSLKPNHYFLSSIELNIEHGIISNPPTKVIRVIAPITGQAITGQAITGQAITGQAITGQDGAASGYVVINYLVTPLLAQLAKYFPQAFNFIILNEKRSVLASHRSGDAISRTDLLDIVRTHDFKDDSIHTSKNGFISYGTRLVTQSQNQLTLLLLGVAPFSSVNPILSLTSVSFAVVALLVIPIVMFIGWLSIVSYTRLQKEFEEESKRYREKSAKYHTILRTALDSIITIDCNGIIESANPATEDLFGYREKELLGKNIVMLMPEPYRTEHQNQFSRHRDTINARIIGVPGREITGLRKNGSQFPIELGVSMMMVNGERKYTGVIRDITERQAHQAEIHRQAYFDQLTHLPNRQMILTRIKQELSTAKRHGYYGAVLFIDLDNFKYVNDVFGHEVGDQLLCQVADRLRKHVRVEDTIGRLGGDEFIMVLNNLAADAAGAVELAITIAEKIRTKVSKQYVIDGRLCLIGASIGVTAFPSEKVNPIDIIGNADMAMYAAKEDGKNKVTAFDSQFNEKLKKRIFLEEKLRWALRNKRFTLLYQPICNPDKEIVGAEALVRWVDEEGAIHLPKEFLSTAEQSKLILEIGNYVVETATEHYCQWRELQDLSDFRLSINLSPVQLHDVEFVAFVQDLIRSKNIEPTNFVFEVPEGATLFSQMQALSTLKALRQFGIGVAIDNFGTGYGSLKQVREMPISAIKIDGSLVRRSVLSQGEQAMIYSVVQLAKRLRLDIVAEGIEQEREWFQSKEYGCDYYQGYYLDQPMTADAFSNKLREQQRDVLHIAH